MSRRGGSAAALVVVLVVVVYLPALDLYFHADDFEWLRASELAVRSGQLLPADVNGHFRPLAEALWAVEYRAFGLGARPYHAVSLLLHVATAALVAAAVRQLLGGGGAALAFAWFAVNAATRSVPLWVSAAPDLLLGLGAAAALVGCLGPGRRRWLALAGVLAALLAKESALLLLPALWLVAPASRRGVLGWVLPAATVAAAVPHLLAMALSPYVRSRFGPGAHVAENLGQLAIGLILPALNAGERGRLGWLGADAAARLWLGGAVLVLVLVLAAARLGRRRALAWSLAVAVALLAPATARDALEPRWLYLPLVFFAPLGVAAVLELGTRLEGRFGRRAGRLAPVVLGTLLVAGHGLVIRAKLARDLGRDAWVRATVVAAAAAPPELGAGDVVEVVVPFGHELRSWPLGVMMAVGRDVEVRPIDDRTAPSPGVAVLDAAVSPPRWRAAGR